MKRNISCRVLTFGAILASASSFPQLGSEIDKGSDVTAERLNALGVEKGSSNLTTESESESVFGWLEKKTKDIDAQVADTRNQRTPTNTLRIKISSNA